MRKENILLLGLIGIFLLSGCVVRTYKVTKERVDQDLTEGNRGYLAGEIPSGEEEAERETTRTTRIIEVELHSPIKFEKMPKAKSEEKSLAERTEEKVLEGNRGFITKSEVPQILEPITLEKYTVQKNDTLQRISQKFYGTTKKWTKIYEANRDILKGPDKIYPGQVINIPTETLKEPKEKLK